VLRLTAWATGVLWWQISQFCFPDYLAWLVVGFACPRHLLHKWSFWRESTRKTGVLRFPLGPSHVLPGICKRLARWEIKFIRIIASVESLDLSTFFRFGLSSAQPCSVGAQGCYMVWEEEQRLVRPVQQSTGKTSGCIIYIGGLWSLRNASITRCAPECPPGLNSAEFWQAKLWFRSTERASVVASPKAFVQ